MTEYQYVFTGCDNRHSIFTFSNQSKVTGVITNLIDSKPTTYYLVVTKNMVEFKRLEQLCDEDGMKKLVTEVNLSTITNVELVD